ncbi:MAG: hypothetical protein H0X67_15605 [Acidobacteria bacterium]|nr:hypothetical protein [Acidobacteriota bacterium]
MHATPVTPCEVEPTLLITIALLTLAAVVAIVNRTRGGASAANLGCMSEHWLNETRNHSD